MILWVMLVLAFIVAIVATKSCWGGFGTFISLFLLLIVAAMLLMCLIVLIASDTLPTEYEYESTEMIVALRDGQSIEGQFFLGTGSVENSPKYYYMIREDGGVRLQSVGTERAIVYETEERTPAIETYKPKFKSSKAQFFFGVHTGSNRYKIYIPPGSVDYQFSIDMNY